MMKILICLKNIDKGGGAIYVRQFIKYCLRQDDIEKIGIIASGKLGIESNKIKTYPLHYYGKSFFVTYPQYSSQANKKIAKILANEKYDILYINSTLKLKKINIPVMATIHGLHIGYIKSLYNGSLIGYIAKYAHKIFKNYDKLTIKNSDKITYVSKKSQKLSKYYYHNIHQNDIYIPAAVDIELFKKSKINKKFLLDKYKLPKNKKIVLYVGRLDPYKDINGLRKVMKKISNKSNTTLLIVGIPNNQKNSTNNELFIPHLTHNLLPEIYSLANIFVLPSFYENCPLSLLEAMSCETFCCASDVGDNKFILQNNSFIFPPGDTNAMKDSLLTALKTNDLNNNFGLANRLIIKNNFSEIVIFDKIKESLNSTINIFNNAKNK